MENILHRLAIILGSLVLLTAPARADEIDDPVALAELAVAGHPSLEALESQADGLRVMADAARLWTDPVVGVELSNLPITRPLLDSHPMAGVQLKLAQKLPAPREPAAREALARGRVRLSERSIDEAANALRGEVRRSYWRLALVRQLRGLTLAHIGEIDDLVAAVRARYEVGGAEQHDLLHLGLRRDRLAEQVLDLDQRAAALLATLNGALARDPSTPIRTPERTPLVALAGTGQSRREALSGNPALALLAGRADLGRLEAERAQVERVPDPSVWLGYRVRVAQASGDVGTNFVTAGVSLPLPAASGRRWKAEELAAGQRTRAAELAAEATRVRLEAELAAAEARHARATARVQTWREALVPAAEGALESTLVAWRVDRATFSDLVRAEVELLDLERELRRSEAEAALARVRIETLMGVKP